MNETEQSSKIIAYSRTAHCSGSNSLARQKDRALAWAAKEGVSIDEDLEECCSGRKMAPGLSKILARAERGEKIQLLVEEPSRIARGLTVLGELLRRAHKCGLAIYFTRDGAAEAASINELSSAVNVGLQIQRAYRRERKHG